jgi:predicted phage terminase large subunit-like protein
MAQLKNGRFLIMDVVRGQWGTSRREMIIRETVRLDGPLVPQYIEQEPGSGGKDSAYITKDTLEKMGNKVFLDRPTGDKIYRADPFSVAVNLGYISIFKGSWNDDFLQELEDFPNTDNKDQVDASSAAYTSLKSSKRAGSW